MKKQLFAPFRFAVWARYAVLGMATGEALSGGCGGAPNFNVPARTGGTNDTTSHFLASTPNLPEHFWVYLIAGLIAAFALMFVWLYVSSVFRFVLFDSVLSGRISIRDGWRKWQEQGISYFGFQLALMFSMWGVIAILIGVPALAIVLATKGAPAGSQHLGMTILAVVLLVMVFFVLVMLSLLVTVLAKDFVVPIMALERQRFTDATRRFLPMLKQDFGSFAGYIGMKIVLAIGAAFITGIVMFVVILALVVPGALVGAMIFAGGALGLTWNPFTITLAVMAGLILLVVLLYLVGFVCAPVTVFFPAYGMHFLAGRYPALAAILYPPPPPQEPPTEPPQPPPLPPEPQPEPAV